MQCCLEMVPITLCTSTPVRNTTAQILVLDRMKQYHGVRFVLALRVSKSMQMRR
ncbi:deoxyhypusine synthase [Cryptococcus deuterogattii 99/473]|uniref:Unplaced genomic scaffold supercont1.6, whole genome shotgun sequence n=1 Tax=Cryptococcus deuterogattii Ram5 TaxID=1296110 RepID=A0A0D0V3J6_9TREE|nr:deoxyhypusine synthase [Cryptococcus deuterogattii Ram5]KIY57263.1 deoxyhypusine synthase [Cryptococcus deuterogattii 99/473]